MSCSTVQRLMGLRPSSGTSELRNDGTASSDQRHAGQDARRARCRAAGRARQSERSRHPPGRTVLVAREAGRARSRDVPTAHGARCRATDGSASGRDARRSLPSRFRTGSSRSSPRPASASRSGTPRQPTPTKAALAQGLTGFTHLFNAMRLPTSREPGPIVAGWRHRTRGSA